MSKRELFDTAALSDPTDSHSLEELRAHLEDGGDIEAETPPDTAGDMRNANFYRLLFGENPKADEILAALGLTIEDIERYRDASIYTTPELDEWGIPEKEAGRRYMVITTRTGGDNRAYYHNHALTHHPLFEWTQDDEYDRTYADYYFRIPDEQASERSSGDGE